MGSLFISIAKMPSFDHFILAAIAPAPFLVFMTPLAKILSAASDCVGSALFCLRVRRDCYENDAGRMHV